MCKYHHHSYCELGHIFDAESVQSTTFQFWEAQQSPCLPELKMIVERFLNVNV